jgi:O-antigen/teichoic acid export membrane protein
MSITEPRTDSIPRNAVFSLASQIATASFTAIITLFLVRKLDPSGYGIFVLALSFAGLLALPADFGVTMSTARFIAERRGNASAIAGVIFQALRLKLVLTSLMALLLIALAEPIASLYNQPALVWPLRAVAIALVAQNLVFLFANIFVAVGRVKSQFVLYMSEGAIEAFATIGLVLLLGGATAAVLGRVAGYSCGVLIGAVLVLRFLGRKAIATRGGAPSLRQFTAYAGVMMIIDASWAVYLFADVLLVGAVLGSTAAGIYSAPLRLVVLLHYPGLAAAQAIAPRMTMRDGHTPDVAALARGLRYMVVLQTAIAVTMAAWAVPLTDLLLGSEFAQSADVMLALTPALFLWGIGPLVSVSLNYRGEGKRRVPIVVGCMLLNIVLLLLLVNQFGVVGAAVSVDISYAVYVGAHLWVCRDIFGLRLRTLASTLVRSSPAALAMGIILLLVAHGGPNTPEWVLGFACALVAFAALAVATRALSTADVREIQTAIVRGLRRASVEAR